MIQQIGGLTPFLTLFQDHKIFNVFVSSFLFARAGPFNDVDLEYSQVRFFFHY